MEANDPVAIYNQGCDTMKMVHMDAHKIMLKHLELLHRAAELGYSAAYCKIGYAYDHCEGVEIDMKKAKHHYELGAIAGNTVARYNLATTETNSGNMDRALRHYMIAVRGGYAKSLEAIKQLYSKGFATKEYYTKALRAYQEYLGEIKSKQRDEAAAFDERYRYY